MNVFKLDMLYQYTTKQKIDEDQSVCQELRSKRNESVEFQQKEKHNYVLTSSVDLYVWKFFIEPEHVILRHRMNVKYLRKKNMPPAHCFFVLLISFLAHIEQTNYVK